MLPRYSWTFSEVEAAQEASLLVAADVIYSDDLTDTFFSTLQRLMSSGSEKVRTNQNLRFPGMENRSIMGDRIPRICPVCLFSLPLIY